MKSKIVIYLVSILFLSGCTSSHEELLYNKKPAFYAYIIGDVAGNCSTIEHEADAYVTPASCQKIVTALLAYKTLGSDYCYQTKLSVVKQSGKIYDVIIEFSGDPSLSSADLIKLLEPLQGKHIPGKITLDASAFQTPAQSPNKVIDDLGTRYAQPVSALNLDRNLIAVKVIPCTLFKPAIIENDAGYLINSEVITVCEKSAVSLTCDGDHIKATGTINVTDKPLEFKITLPLTNCDMNILRNE